VLFKKKAPFQKEELRTSKDRKRRTRPTLTEKKKGKKEGKKGPKIGTGKSVHWTAEGCERSRGKNPPEEGKKRKGAGRNSRQRSMTLERRRRESDRLRGQPSRRRRPLARKIANWIRRSRVGDEPEWRNLIITHDTQDGKLDELLRVWEANNYVARQGAVPRSEGD